MPNLDATSQTFFIPGDEHGGMGPFLRPVLAIDRCETSCVVKVGARELFGMSPYLSSKAPKPMFKAEFEHGTIRTLMRLREPEVIFFENILSEAECKYLIARAKQKLTRSFVVDHETGDGVEHPIRTSAGMSFKRGETHVIKRIEERIAHLIQWPATKTEPIALLRYRPGEFYNEHYDYFDYQTVGSEVHRANGGNRVATLLLYLNDCEAGGETLLADVGLEALPRQGCGVYFAYPNPHASSMTRHAGRPPKKGQKWIATVWFKEGKFA